MHNAIAHHPEPNAQPIPEPRSLLPLPGQLPSSILSMTSYGTEYPLG